MARLLLLVLATLLAAAASQVQARDLLDAGVNGAGVSSADPNWWYYKHNPDFSPPTFCHKWQLPKTYYGSKFRPNHHWCPTYPPNPPSPTPPRPSSPTPPPATCPTGKQPVAYVNLLRSNDSLPTIRSSGAGIFGQMKDKAYLDVWRVLPSSAAVAYAAVPPNSGGYTLPADSGYAKFKAYSNNPDIPTLHPRGDNIYMVNHFEYNQPGSFYFTKLTQDKSTGQLTQKATEAIKDGPGSWFPCSGTITPWDSHLGSEEYPADCRIYEETLQNPATCKAQPDFAACGWIKKAAYDADSAMAMSRKFGGQSMHPISQDDEVDTKDPAIINFEKNMGFGSQTVLDNFRRFFNCYEYGASPEVTISMDGTYNYRKWWTLGRVAHESAIVMPDGKTVYTTDDGTNCGFFMFKADNPGDLSSGTLYASKWKQVGAVTDTSANYDVSWIKLGAATQEELTILIGSRPLFSDIFTTADVDNTTGSCPSGFLTANTPASRYLWPETADTTTPAQAYIECLKVKPGMETAAAFLETRRYASMLGATTEFEKEEGVTYSKKRMEMYVAFTKVSAGMTSDTKWTANQPGDVNMPENGCGVIFAFPLDSEYTATAAKAVLYGHPMPKDADGNKCTLDGMANPDNIHYTNDIMFLAEDTSSHLNNVLWAWDMTSNSLTRILSSPRLAEVTGVYISYVGDYAYLMLAMQHPEEDTPAVGLTKEIALSQRGYLGYIGPLNAACLKAGKKPVFDGIAAASMVEEKSAVLYTKWVTYV